MKKGVAQLTLLFSMVGLLFTTAIGVGWNSLSRSNEAIDRVSAVEKQMAVIDTKLDFLVKQAGGTIDPQGDKILITLSTSTKK